MAAAVVRENERRVRPVERALGHDDGHALRAGRFGSCSMPPRWTLPRVFRRKLTEMSLLAKSNLLTLEPWQLRGLRAPTMTRRSISARWRPAAPLFVGSEFCRVHGLRTRSPARDSPRRRGPRPLQGPGLAGRRLVPARDGGEHRPAGRVSRSRLPARRCARRTGAGPSSPRSAHRHHFGNRGEPTVSQVYSNGRQRRSAGRFWPLGSRSRAASSSTRRAAPTMDAGTGPAASAISTIRCSRS